MAQNQLLTISMITKESLRVLVGSLSFTNKMKRSWDDEFNIKGAKIGQTINIRKPARYVGRTGPVVSIEAQTETYVPLTLNQQYGVDLAFTSAEETMSLDLYSDRVIKPAMANIASRIDAFNIANTWNSVYNQVGTPGSAVTTLQTYLQAGVILDNNLAPRDGMRSFITDPNTQATATGLGLNLFNPAKEISEQYKTGLLTDALGFEWYLDQQANSHTNGAFGGTPIVGAGGQSGSTINTTGWSSGASTLTAGTVITFAGSYAVNPQTKQKLGVLQQFVVTADTSDTTGSMAIPVSPALVLSGAFQNVSAAPTSGGAVVVSGASGVTNAQSMVMHTDAFAFGCSELDLYQGLDMASRATDPETGLSVRIIRDYDVRNDQLITRFDILFGSTVLYTQLACRVATS